MRGAWWFLAGVSALGIAAWLLRADEAQDRGVAAVRGDATRAAATLAPTRLLQQASRVADVAASPQVPFHPRDCTAGVACPGGGFLPLLNGVPYAQPLYRNVELFGPVPTVVGKRVDQAGDEWWVHADGSETTTRWMTMHVDGVLRRDVRTDHAVPPPIEHGLAPGRDGAR